MAINDSNKISFNRLMVALIFGKRLKRLGLIGLSQQISFVYRIPCASGCLSITEVSRDALNRAGGGGAYQNLNCNIKNFDLICHAVMLSWNSRKLHSDTIQKLICLFISLNVSNKSSAPWTIPLQSALIEYSLPL